MYLPLRTEDIKQYLSDNNDDIDCIYLTSPNYEGMAANIHEIREAYPEKIIAVDEAHGGHHYFNTNMPLTSMEQGADLCTVSIHKTLGGICGTAMVLVSPQSKVSQKDVLDAKNLLHTSSPSFFLLADVESRVAQMVNEGENLVNGAIELNNYMREELQKIEHVEVQALPNQDKTKTVIKVKGLSGKKLNQLLSEEFNVWAEKYTQKAVLITVHTHITKKDV